MKNKIISIIAALIITLPLAAQVKKAKAPKVEAAPVVKEVLDRSIRPQAGPAPIIKIGEYQSFELANGLKVFVVENHKIPRLSYSLVLDNDPVFEGDMAGYADIAGQLMRTGTTTRTKDQIDEQIDMLGANLNTSADGMSANCLSRHNEDYSLSCRIYCSIQLLKLKNWRKSVHKPFRDSKPRKTTLKPFRNA
jgi:hypothetical protein